MENVIQNSMNTVIYIEGDGLEQTIDLINLNYKPLECPKFLVR